MSQNEEHVDQAPAEATTVIQKDRVRSFFDESTWWQGRIYDDMSDRFNRTMVRRKRYVMDMFTSVPGSQTRRVLDVGCGCGEYSKELHHKGYDVYGIDLSPSMIESCRLRLGFPQEDGVSRFRCGDIEHIPFPDSSFDAILCIGVFGYLLSDDEAIRELLRVLKPNGWCLISVQNALSLSNLDYFARRKLRSMFHRSGQKPDESFLKSLSWTIPTNSHSSAGDLRYKAYNPWMLERHLSRMGFIPKAHRTYGYEFRIVRRYHSLPEPFLTSVEQVLEKTFHLLPVPYLSNSGESYIGLFQKNVGGNPFSTSFPDADLITELSCG